MTGEEFVRRFLLHVLPRRMHRLRYAGMYSARHRQTSLETCRRLLEGATDNLSPVTQEEEDHADDFFLGEEEPVELRAPPCPRCGMPEMRSLGRLTYEEFLRRLCQLHAFWSSIVTVIIVSGRYHGATSSRTQLSPDPSPLSPGESTSIMTIDLLQSSPAPRTRRHPTHDAMTTRRITTLETRPRIGVTLSVRAHTAMSPSAVLLHSGSIVVKPPLAAVIAPLAIPQRWHHGR